MKCEKAQELFSDYLEGTLERPMEFMLEHHLKDCHTCERDYQRFSETWDALEGLPEVEVPLGLRATIMERVQTQQETRKKRSWSIDLAGIFGARIQVRAVAAAAAIVLFGVMAVKVTNGPVVMTDVHGTKVPQVQLIGDKGDYVVAQGTKTETFKRPGLSITVSAFSDDEGTTHYTIKLKPSNGSDVDVKAYVTQQSAIGMPRMIESTNPVVFGKLLQAGQSESFPVVVGRNAEPEAVYIKWMHDSLPQSAVVYLQTK